MILSGVYIACLKHQPMHQRKKAKYFKIILIGDRNKGWQFGENLRTQCSGWFPLAYTEALIDDSAT